MTPVADQAALQSRDEAASGKYTFFPGNDLWTNTFLKSG